MPYRKTILFLLLPATLISQNITGKIYDAESTVKGAKILNKTKNITTHSDENGNFDITASPNDSLLITSLFHLEKHIKIDDFYLQNTIVVELTKQVNNLDEVLLAEKRNELKTFEINSDLGAILAYDLKNNPETWYKDMPKSGIDIIAVALLIGKLLKNKKEKPQPKTTINFKTFDSLFSSSNKRFNKSLLINDLKIPEAHFGLFFDYCDAQSIDTNLLLEENDFMLLDQLLKCSNNFLEILKTAKDD